ncbi:MAG: hypothetical protein Q8Q16_03790 [Betaproteobacteria bacterium]|nr:hypothetical protein [Betaproteobacteria bacterium]
MISISYFVAVVLAAALPGFVRFLVDDAACHAILTVYAVRSFSPAFDLDQQSMASRALA